MISRISSHDSILTNIYMYRYTYMCVYMYMFFFSTKFFLQWIKIVWRTTKLFFSALLLTNLMCILGTFHCKSTSKISYLWYYILFFPDIPYASHLRQILHFHPYEFALMWSFTLTLWATKWTHLPAFKRFIWTRWCVWLSRAPLIFLFYFHFMRAGMI